MSGTKGKSGRPRKPTELHSIQGTGNVTRLREQGRDKSPDFAPLDEIPEPVTLSAAGSKYWRYIMRILGPSGVLKSSDGLSLAMICEELAAWETMNNQISNSGAAALIHVQKNREGHISGTQMTGIYKVRKAAFENAMKGLAQFGMTPTDRSRIIGDIDAKKESNSFSKFS